MSWTIGDWATCEGVAFRIVAILGEFLMANDVMGYRASACVKLDTQECGRCKKQAPNAQEVRYSYTVYAGKMCDECAYNGYRDHCGLVDGQGSAEDLDEPLEPEDY